MITTGETYYSIKDLFLNDTNVNKLSSKLGRDVKSDMIQWTKTYDLDDYESIQMNITETVNFINNQFINKYKETKDGSSNAQGQKYPKYTIKNNTNNYTINDFRTHDAQFVQEVIRSNKNFRHNNKLMPWETGLYKRHYDRDEHGLSLGNFRELQNEERGYDMKNTYVKNPYKSSDSILFENS